MTPATPPSTAGTPAIDALKALKSLVDREPQRHPLVIALAAPVGTKLESIQGAIKEELERYGYHYELIELSKLVDSIPAAPWGQLPQRGQPGYHTARMNAGDRLRAETGSGATLAALAIGKIAPTRNDHNQATAYVLRSLKHPEEAALLRHVYGDAFWLVSVVTDSDERREDLIEDLTRASATFGDPLAEAENLIARDEDDGTETFGQHVRDLFGTADVYLPIHRGYDCRPEVARFLEGVFGKPFLTPRASEEAMLLAHNASLRSAAVGRQVGAVLVPATGTTYITGTNEVPKPGGGQFWTGDEPDHRDFRTGHDPNPAYTSRMLQEFLDHLNKSEWLAGKYRGLPADELLRRASTKDDAGVSLISGTRASSVIEFTRCLHAEQAAIVNAARQGVATANATLYTTTFPCHECAKFIVGAGIQQVVYVEPYPKNLVRQLYRDLIDTRPPLETGISNDAVPAVFPEGKVPFRPFVGFAPSRYGIVFLAGKRRSGSGLAEFDRLKAHPRGGGWSEPGIQEREAAAVAAVTRLVREVYKTTVATAPKEEAPSHPEPATRIGDTGTEQG